MINKNILRLATARAGNVIGGGDWAPSRIVPDCIRAWSESKLIEIAFDFEQVSKARIIPNFKLNDEYL